MLWEPKNIVKDNTKHLFWKVPLNFILIILAKEARFCVTQDGPSRGSYFQNSAPHSGWLSLSLLRNTCCMHKAVWKTTYLMMPDAYRLRSPWCLVCRDGWCIQLIRDSSFCEIKQVVNLPNEVWAVPAWIILFNANNTRLARLAD